MAQRVARVAMGQEPVLIDDGDMISDANSDDPQGLETLEYEHDPDQGLDSVAALAMSLDQIPVGEEGVRMMIYRIGDGSNGRADAYLFECTPEEFNSKGGGLGKIRRDYGGGTYRIRVFRKMQQRGKQGQTFIRQQQFTNRVVQIEESRVPEPVTPQREENGSAQLASLAELMMREQQATRDSMREMVQGVAQAIAQIGANRPPEKNTMDMLKEIAAIKEIFAPPPVAPVHAPRPVDTVNQLKEMLEVVGMVKDTVSEVDSGDSPEGFVSLGRKLLEVVQGGGMGPLTQAPAPQQAPARPAAPRPIAMNPRGPATPAPGSPAPAPQSMEGEKDMMALIRAAVAQLVRAAENNSNPISYAEVVLDQAGDDVAHQFLSTDDWFDTLAGLNPKVNEHREWFTELREEALRLLSETDDDTSLGNALPEGPQTGVSLQSDENNGDASGNS